MEKVFLIDSEPVPSAPMGRFLPREVVVKIYPDSNIQRLKYIFKYNTPQELPKEEAIELLKRFPSMSLVDPDGEEVKPTEEYERMTEFKLTGEEKRQDLLKIVHRLLLKPGHGPTLEGLKDLINAELAMGRFPLTEEAFDEYKADEERKKKEKQEARRLKTKEEAMADVAKWKEDKDVNVS